MNRLFTFIKNQRGLTLVEMIAVLILLAIVVLAGMQLYNIASANWNRAASSSIAMLDASRVMQDISYDLRSAQKFSATGSKAVKLLNAADGMPCDGAGIAIYHINTDVSPIAYEVVFYWVDSNKDLHRGVGSNSTDTITRDLPYNDPSVIDKTIAHGITIGQLFTDNTVDPASPAPARERREVAVNITLEDTRPRQRFAAINLNSTYLTRSQEIGALNPDGTRVVRVSGIDMVFSNLSPSGSTVYNSSLNSIDVPRNGGSFTVTASFIPPNATNQNLTWSKSGDFITPSNNHAASISVTIESNDGLFAGRRSGSLTLKADDGNWTCNLTIRQAGVLSL